MKEILRESLEKISGLKLLIIIKPTAATLTFLEKKEQISYLLRRVIKERNENEKK